VGETVCIYFLELTVEMTEMFSRRIQLEWKKILSTSLLEVQKKYMLLR